MFRPEKLARMAVVGLLAGLPAAWPCASRAEAPATAAEPATTAATSPAPASRTLYYQVRVGGTPAGEMTLREGLEGERRVQESSMRLEFRRAGDRQTLAMASRFVEAADGRPLEAWSRQELGAVPVETRYLFTEGRVDIESRQGESVVVRQVPDPGGWLAPAAAQAEVDAKIAAALAGGADHFEVSSLDPMLGPQVVKTEWRLEARDAEVEIDGKKVPASRWRQTQSFAPQIATIAYLSAEGDLLESRTQLAGLDMVITLTDRPPEAAAAGAPELGRAPEMLVNTFLHPDRKLSQPRSQRRVVYQLYSKTPLDLPTVGFQRVDRPQAVGDRYSTRVVVDLDHPGSAEAEPLAPYLAASTFLNHEDAAVRALHKRALAQWSGRREERAELLRRFVHGYLDTKDLRTVLATASEVAANASGDCTEHAVLLAALLRAERIPARVAFGLIYVDHFAGARDIFGYHLWTQAWLDDRWVDLDATLAQPFDAAHLTLGTSSLDDEVSALAAMTGALELFANAELKILSPR